MVAQQEMFWIATKPVMTLMQNVFFWFYERFAFNHVIEAVSIEIAPRLTLTSVRPTTTCLLGVIAAARPLGVGSWRRRADALPCRAM